MPAFEPSPAAFSYSGPSTVTVCPLYGPVRSVMPSAPFAQAIEHPYQQPSLVRCVQRMSQMYEAILCVSGCEPY